jgi:hypothetical protein
VRRQEEQRGENEKLNLVSIDAILAFAVCAFCHVFSLRSLSFCV